MYFKFDAHAPEKKGHPEKAVPYIYFEASSEDLSILKNGSLQFEFLPGTPHSEVERIKNFLNENVDAIGYTDYSEIKLSRHLHL